MAQKDYPLDNRKVDNIENMSDDDISQHDAAQDSGQHTETVDSADEMNEEDNSDQEESDCGDFQDFSNLEGNDDAWDGTYSQNEDGPNEISANAESSDLLRSTAFSATHLDNPFFVDIHSGISTYGTMSGPTGCSILHYCSNWRH